PSTPNPSARLAPEPPNSSATHDSGRPASLSACQSGAFHAPFLSLLISCASARSAKIFSAVSTTMFSLSATAFLLSYSLIASHPLAPRPVGAGKRIFYFFLRCMMGKSQSRDKHCSQGTHAGGRQFRATEFPVSRRGMVDRRQLNAPEHNGETHGEGWIV